MAERAQIPIPEELLEHVERGNVLLFIGERLADTPGEPGVPDRLREALAARVGYPADSDLSFAELAQIYDDSHGRNALVQFMRDQLAAFGDLAFAAPERPTLIKLYGDLQQRDTLVVTEDDHYGLWRSRDKEGLLDEVRRALRSSAVLFIGYNLADPDFLLLWRELLDRMGQFAIGGHRPGHGRR